METEQNKTHTSNSDRNQAKGLLTIINERDLLIILEQEDNNN